MVGYAFVPLVIGAIAPRLGARIRLTSLAGGHLTQGSNVEYHNLFCGGHLTQGSNVEYRNLFWGGHLTLGFNVEYRNSFWGGYLTLSIEEGLGDRGAVERILAPMSEGRSPERLGGSSISYPHLTTPCGSDKTTQIATLIQ